SMSVDDKKARKVAPFATDWPIAVQLQSPRLRPNKELHSLGSAFVVGLMSPLNRQELTNTKRSPGLAIAMSGGSSDGERPTRPSMSQQPANQKSAIKRRFIVFSNRAPTPPDPRH